VGGGSTEFIFGSGRAIDSSCSFNIGALGLTETYIRTDPVAVADFDSLLRELEVSLGKLTSHRFDLLIGIGGAITNMAAIKHQLTVYDSSLVHGSVLDLAEVERQIELFLSMNLAERRRLTGLEPGRADTILAGAGIVLSVMKTLDTDRVTVSDRGLRQGLVLDRFGCE